MTTTNRADELCRLALSARHVLAPWVGIGRTVGIPLLKRQPSRFRGTSSSRTARIHKSRERRAGVNADGTECGWLGCCLEKENEEKSMIVKSSITVQNQNKPLDEGE